MLFRGRYHLMTLRCAPDIKLFALLTFAGLLCVYVMTKQTGTCILSLKSTLPNAGSIKQNEFENGREDIFENGREDTYMYMHNYSLFGLIPSVVNRTKRIQTPVSTALLYTFPSSLLDGKFDSDLSVKAELMSVAMSGRPRVSRQGGRYFDLVLRTYVKNATTIGTLQRSYLMKLSVNASYGPVDRGHFLGIPAVVHGNFGGPEDTRMFEIANETVIVYSMTLEGSTSMESTVCRMFLYNIDTDEGPKRIKVKGMRLLGREKNWVPISLTERERTLGDSARTNDETLNKPNVFFLVYSLIPVVLLRCDFPSAVCTTHDPKLEYLEESDHFGSGTLTRPADGVRDAASERRLKSSVLRNGTPFLHYKNGLHIALVHRYFRKTYSVYFLVYSTKIYDIIYISDPVHFNRGVYHMAPKMKYNHHFIYPTSLILINPDTLHIGAHVNDAIAVMLKMTGIKDLMETLFKQDFRSGLSEEDIERHLKASD